MEFRDIFKEAYYQDKTGMLLNGDCLNWMSEFPDKSIDMVLCDLPYERTHNSWDAIIPFDLLWKQYNRIIKDNGVLALFADGMFMAELMISNKKMWKYNLIWDKVLSSGFLNANKMPLRQHEEICIFYNKRCTYNPQKIKGNPSHSKGKVKTNENNNYGTYKFVDNGDKNGDMKFPTSILRFPKNHPSKIKHPTEKSLECYEWLIKTYTNENEIVLDNASGSGTNAIACMNTNRKWICIEKEQKYCDVSIDRIKEMV